MCKHFCPLVGPPFWEASSHNGGVPRRIDPMHIDPACLPSILSRCVRTQTGCLEWTGFLNRDGYGVVAVRSPVDRRWRSMYVHRVTFFLHWGFLPSGRLTALDHACRNPACCDWEHLQAVTTRENNLRGERVTDRCVNGHFFDEENTYWSKPKTYRESQRMCRACDRERKRRRRHPGE
jgi:hypothetical protein